MKKGRVRRILILFLFFGIAIAGIPTDVSAEPITDMSVAYDIILNQADKTFISGYPVDESFLMWVNAVYGDEAIEKLVEAVGSGMQDENLWYELTGNSMHVLWLLYAKECGFERYQLENVFWTDCQSTDKAVLSCAPGGARF